MRILVTGGAGFIGSHICRDLLREGHEVVCLDNFDPYYDPAYKRQNLEGLDLKLVEGSVTDFDLIKKLCQDCEFIYHEAAQAGVRTSVENPMKSYNVNTEGTLNVLKAALDSGIKKVVNASSSSVYGTVKYLPFDESHPNNPISPYGVSKLAAEQYCNVFSELYGLKTVNLRYFTVYGPRMRPDLAISVFVKNALKNEPLPLFGDGHKTRDFTYVDDIVAGNLLLLKKGEGTFNLGGEGRISINELAERIIKISGSKSKIIHSEDAKGDVEHTWADVKRAKDKLGWGAKVDIDEGLKRFVEYMKKRSEG